MCTMLPSAPMENHAISGDGTTAHVWEVASGKQLSSVRMMPMFTVLVSARMENTVVSGGRRLTVVWEPLTGKKIFQVKHDGIVQRVAFSPDGKIHDLRRRQNSPHHRSCHRQGDRPV